MVFTKEKDLKGKSNDAVWDVLDKKENERRQ